MKIQCSFNQIKAASPRYHLQPQLPYDAKERNKVNWKCLVTMVMRGWVVLELPPILFINLK